MDVRVGLVGMGQVTLGVHVPTLRALPGVKLTALCGTNASRVAARARVMQIPAAFTDYRELVASDEVDAVVVSTPNHLHAPIVLDAIRAGKHVLCEKPLGMNLAETIAMWRAARNAGVVHMVAFTYRFVPAMRYLHHLVVEAGAIGRPLHFRANRLQDFGDQFLGWRQSQALAGTGELGDMGSHRIDYAQLLVGRIARVTGLSRCFIPDRVGKDRAPRPAADVEDWVAFLAEFDGGQTGVFEMSKIASGRGTGAAGLDFVEINGTEGSVVYRLDRPHEIEIGKRGGALELQRVPESYLKVPGAPRDALAGEPSSSYRADQAFEWVDAIRARRDASPSFRDGAACQAVIDAVVESSRSGRWVDVPNVDEMIRGAS